jgi:hypothetical protein
MIKSFFLILLFLPIASQAQVTFRVDNFSPDYYGKVFVKDSGEVFSPGWVEIFDRRSDKKLIHVDGDELALHLHDGKVLANIAELPYGEQSVIQYEDVNFDGVKDFIIEDGQHSCYHGPSYQVFLAHDGKFKSSPSFTELAQEYCGMFDVDDSAKMILTMQKSGCCWHQFSQFVVRDNKPRLMSRTEDGALEPPFESLLQITRHGETNLFDTVNHIEIQDFDSLNPSFSFRLATTSKTAMLFQSDGALYYALLRLDSSVEFASTSETQFTLTRSTNRLRFQNNGVTYEIDGTEQKPGIHVVQKHKTSYLEGTPSSTHGHLMDLEKLQLKNLVLR